jgi:molybdenum cofactor synthesis domain-containing protein
MFTVEVISVGNELLNGKTANTNLQWLGARIYSLGGWIRRAVTVPDLLDEVSSAIKESLSRKPDLIITTGGLGPTYDDRTLEGVALALGRKLVVNEEALAMLKKRYEELYEKGAMDTPQLTESRSKMARLPEGGRALRNHVGTAPGLMIEAKGVRLVSLPGVPAEMKDMFERYVAPLFPPAERVCERFFVVEGIPESTLAPELEKVAKAFPGFYIKSHPKGFEGGSRIEVQIKGRGKACEEMEKAVESMESVLRKLGGSYHIK